MEITDTLDPAQAAAELERRLALGTDPSDVHAALSAGTPGFVLVDSRGEQAWAQGHVPGALHLPTARIAAEAAGLVDPGLVVVTHCWGPGCNGATRAALAFARLGYRVKEMQGGFEYWAREGLPVEVDGRVHRRAPDPLTAPAGHAVTCDC
ncbi:rhodanese-like domain-containing protein [Kineococcus sp. SYSU DK006]|uniref:rhodanese-like domain-containing protein n=1 Tax=Kineococcus sp. SYSU DK006 TaxID=3383127 RepID=UPI003D7D38D4